MSLPKLYVGNPNTIALSELADVDSGDAIIDATVQVTLQTRSGSDVPGITWPVTLPHVGDARYQTTLSDQLSLVPNKRYVLIWSATSATYENAGGRVLVNAAIRRD